MARKNLTTAQRIPVTGNKVSLMTGERRPALLQDIRLIEKQEMTL
jgi:catalase